MVVLLILSLLALAAVALRLALPALRRQLIVWELRGDWWSRFERDFNAYTAGLRNAAEMRRRGSRPA